MKKILFVYTKMVVGGSTTSLLSILNNLDYDKYQVDLLLLDKSGDLQYLINEKVNVLDIDLGVNPLRRFFHPMAILDRIRGEICFYHSNNRLIKAQFNSAHMANAMKSLNKEYDIAISFLEFWPLRYLATKINAAKKIAWIHIDPLEAGLKRNVSDRYLDVMDRIILVSNSCKNNFDQMFPKLKNKSIVIENILDSSIIRKMSKEECSLSIDSTTINFVTVCRINIRSKALDRVVKAFAKLREEGLDIEKRIRWYIIGDGPDLAEFENIVRKAEMNNIVMLGKQLNPYKYEAKMDYFILPSKYEGKPMAVTEAQMLGVVPVVCKYSSAPEQIQHMVDGYIAENSDEGIIQPIRLIYEQKIDHEKMKEQLLQCDYSNLYVMNQITSLLD